MGHEVKRKAVKVFPFLPLAFGRGGGGCLASCPSFLTVCFTHTSCFAGVNEAG